MMVAMRRAIPAKAARCLRADRHRSTFLACFAEKSPSWRQRHAHDRHPPARSTPAGSRNARPFTVSCASTCAPSTRPWSMASRAPACRPSSAPTSRAISSVARSIEVLHTCSARAVSVPCWWRSRAAAADSGEVGAQRLAGFCRQVSGRPLPEPGVHLSLCTRLSMMDSEERRTRPGQPVWLDPSAAGDKQRDTLMVPLAPAGPRLLRGWVQCLQPFH